MALMTPAQHTPDVIVGEAAGIAVGIHAGERLATIDTRAHVMAWSAEDCEAVAALLTEAKQRLRGVAIPEQPADTGN